MNQPAVLEKVFLVKSPLGRIGLACAVKRTYAIGRGRLSLADEQVPLTRFPKFAPDRDGDPGELLDDSDMLPIKEATDVVLRGSAHAPNRTSVLTVGLAVSGFARRLRVLGERRVDATAAGVVRFSSPEPFDGMELGYSVAYGGYDSYAHDQLDPVPTPSSEVLLDAWPDLKTSPPRRYPGLFAYPRNHAGVGYFIDIDRHRADGAALPRLEDPEDPLTPERFFVPSPTAWIDAPIPGSFGWVAYAWYPRLLRAAGPLLVYDKPSRPPREAELGDGDDLADPMKSRSDATRRRVIQGAAPGLARERLRGDEPVVLEHLHPHYPELRFELPGEVPRFALGPPGLKSFTPGATLQTVRIEPDRNRVILTWMGVVPLLAAPRREFVDETTLSVDWVR